MDEFISGLNEVILKYITNSEVYDISELSPIECMSNIILSSKCPCFNDKIKNRFGLSKSLELSYEFFNFLSNDYGKYFLDRIGSDSIIYAYDPKGRETATSFHENGEKMIYFPYCENICDSFTITHEMFHDMNLDINNINSVRDLFTEYISIFGEMLFDGFISSNYDIKCCFNNRYTFNSCYLKAIKVDFYINLVKCFLDNGYIYRFHLYDIIDRFNPYYQNYLLGLIDKFISDGSFPIIYEYRYLLGILLSCYSKDLMRDGKFSIELFQYINENINFIDYDDLYSILSLDVYDDYTLLLSNESYDKLCKSYRKNMGSI